jgi:hypothetical protein
MNEAEIPKLLVAMEHLLSRLSRRPRSLRPTGNLSHPSSTDRVY